MKNFKLIKLNSNNLMGNSQQKKPTWQAPEIQAPLGFEFRKKIS